jgi:hypothetical protein
MGIQNVNTRIMVGKLEGTAGTAESLLSADFDVKLMAPECAIEIQYDDEAAKFASGDHAADYAIPGKRSVTPKATHRLAWSGSYATAPNAFKFARGCGHKLVEYRRAITGAAASGQKNVPVSTTGSPFIPGQIVTLKEGANTENCTISTVGTNTLTMVANLTNTYTTSGFVYTGQSLQPLKETDATTMTVGCYAIENGAAAPVATQFLSAGTMGNVELMAEGSGGVLGLSFDMKGKYAGYNEISNANIPAFSGNCNEVADALLGATLTVGGTAIAGVGKFAINCGIGVELLEDAGDASGYKHAIVAKREPRISFDMFAGTATDTAISDALSATSAEIILSTEHFQIRAPKCQPVSPSKGERNGVYTWSKSYRPMRNCTTAGAALDTAIPTECTYEIIMGRRC